MTEELGVQGRDWYGGGSVRERETDTGHRAVKRKVSLPVLDFMVGTPSHPLSKGAADEGRVGGVHP